METKGRSRKAPPFHSARVRCCPKTDPKATGEGAGHRARVFGLELPQISSVDVNSAMR